VQELEAGDPEFAQQVEQARQEICGDDESEPPAGAPVPARR
jgi:hypothetical protein